MGVMPFKKNAWRKPSTTVSYEKQPNVPLLDLSGVSVPQSEAELVVCVYNAPDDITKIKKRVGKKCSGLAEVRQGNGVVWLSFSTLEQASFAVQELNGASIAGSPPLIVCKDMRAPLMTSGHQPGFMVLRNVPDGITIPDVWSALNEDNIKITHISFLKTSTLNIMMYCETQECCQLLLAKTGTRVGDWKIKVELWFELCFQMTRRNVLLIEELPQSCDEGTLRQLIGQNDGIEYIELVPEHNCALVYCKSKDILNTILQCNTEPLKKSLYQQVSGLRYLVFLENLHETVKEADVHKLLSDCGSILKVNVSLDQRTGKKRAVAYFENEESVEKALKLNSLEFHGEHISLFRSMKNKFSNAVFVTNLHRGTTGLHLCLIFQDCGFIESVSVPSQKNIVNGKETAVVIFKNPEAAVKAMEKSNKSKIRGMRIIVHREDPYAQKHKRKQYRKQMKEKIISEGPRTRKESACSKSPRKKKKLDVE